jgi:uncharacterized nucleotidyltransferase DUF6036
MKRAEFEHAIRAAGSILGTSRLLVIGTQALHASVSSRLPAAAQRSIEVDIAVFGDRDGAKADLIDGSIGAGSMFHETFGYYAQGVTEATAVLPRGWRKRLIPFETPATGGVVAYCLEPHDLWVAKAIANRDKDIEFCDELLRENLVDRELLDSRLKSVAGLDPRITGIVRSRIARPRA